MGNELDSGLCSELDTSGACSVLVSGAYEHGLFNVAVIRVLFSFNVKAVMHFIHKKQLLYATVRGCYFLAKLTALLMFL